LVGVALILFSGVGLVGYAATLSLDASEQARAAATSAATDAAASKATSLTNREIGWQRGAVDCIEILVDDESVGHDPPTYCRRPEVVVWYPSWVCPWVGDPVGCAARADEIGPGG
jgi:hypothetical protein